MSEAAERSGDRPGAGTGDGADGPAAGGAGGGTGWRDILNRRYGAAVLLVSLGVWLHAADGLIVSTMLPAMVADIGGGRLVGWAFALYEVGTIVAGAAGGVLALRVGLRAPMAAAALIFAAGCAISALAPTMPVLLGGRILQGAGGGGLVALSFVAVTRLFPRHLIPRVLAAMSILWGGSAFLGPLAGGIFVTYATWRWGFAFFGIQALALALLIGAGLRQGTAPPSRDAGARLPWRRLLILCLAILGVAAAGIAAGPGARALCLGAGLVALALFGWLDGRAGPDRLWPRGAFDPRHAIGAAFLMVIAMNVATMGLPAYGAILMEARLATPALVAGYVVAGVSIAWSVSAVLVAGAPERFDPAIIATGMAMVFLSVAGMVHAMASGPVWMIAAFAAMEGFGYGMAWSFILRRGTRLVADEDVERLSAALPTAGHLGYALGASAVGIFANAAGITDRPDAVLAVAVARAVFWGSLPIAALGVLAMLRFVTAKG